MRKITTVFCLLLLLSAMACLSPPTPQEMLIGTWETVELVDARGAYENMTLSFEGDGRFSADIELSDSSIIQYGGSYLALESTITFTYELDDSQDQFVDEMTYKFEGGLLSIFDTETIGWGMFRRVK